MKLIIDIGNTKAKLVAFDGNDPVEEMKTSGTTLEDLPVFISKYTFERGIVSTVRDMTPKAESSLMRVHALLMR